MNISSFLDSCEAKPDFTTAVRQVIEKAVEAAPGVTFETEWEEWSRTRVLQEINATEQEVAAAAIVGNHESPEANAVAFLRP